MVESSKFREAHTCCLRSGEWFARLVTPLYTKIVKECKCENLAIYLVFLYTKTGGRNPKKFGVEIAYTLE